MSKETGVVPETSARVHFDIMNIYHGDNKEMDAVNERIHLTNSSGAM